MAYMDFLMNWIEFEIIFCDKMIGKYIHRLKYSNFQQCLATMLLISKFPVFNYLLHVKGLDN